MRGFPSAPASTLSLSDGRVVTLVESLGRGTLGEVYRGVLESGWGLRHPVAVKLFNSLRDDEHDELMRRLARNGRRAAYVRHPSFVQTLEIDQTDPTRAPRALIVMELVDGASLATLLTSWREGARRVPVDFALVVALKVAEGLGAALDSETADGGRRALVHGDLSPRQVLVSDQGDVKVGDFGQGDLRDVVSHVRSRYAIGYTAPEVACGLEADARSDVFSLGVMFHEMVLGARFAPKTPTDEVVRMVRDGQFHVSIMEPNLPRDLRAVIDRSLAPTPFDRYPNAQAFAFDLRREMLRMGLCDAQTCIRQAVVDCCELRDGTDAPPAVARRSEVVPRSSNEDTSPEIRRGRLR